MSGPLSRASRSVKRVPAGAGERREASGVVVEPANDILFSLALWMFALGLATRSALLMAVSAIIAVLARL